MHIFITKLIFFVNLHARFSAIQYIHNVHRYIHTHMRFLLLALCWVSIEGKYIIMRTQRSKHYVYCAAVRRQCVWAPQAAFGRSYAAAAVVTVTLLGKIVFFSFPREARGIASCNAKLKKKSMNFLKKKKKLSRTVL